MRFTDLFIRRPVLSIVVCLLIVVMGVHAGLSLPIQRFPQTVSATIQVSTTYYGADAATMAGFVTTPIENAISATGGVDYIDSTSATSLSTVTLHLRLNQDPKAAIAQVQAYVSAIGNKLPPGTQQPVITMTNNEGSAMYIAVSSRTLRPEQVSDYASRVVLPQLQAVPGVLHATDMTEANLALRVWFDARRLAGYGLTASAAVLALQENDYVTGVGTTMGGMSFTNLAITSGLHTEEQFRNLVLIRSGSAIIKLGDVARIELGPEATNIGVTDGLGQGAFIRVTLTPGANMLETAAGLRMAFAHIVSGLPPDIRANIVFDLSDFVRASLQEVMRTLAEAVVIVAVVIFLFLGSFRSVLIPLVTIPVSLIGTLALMKVLGFSVNSLTLLALVLAIGLVVDDAIIMVENVNRHLANGQTPLQASLSAGRELAGPVIAMTVVLIAAYIPVGLQKGLIGALFTEFAFTLAASVTVSAVLALTLSPMMCACLLRPHGAQAGRLVRLGDSGLHLMHRVYANFLRHSLSFWPVTVILAFFIMGATGWMFRGARSELAPPEDMGLVAVAGQAPPSTTLDFVKKYNASVLAAFKTIPEMRDYWLVDAPRMQDGGIALTAWDKRTRTATEIQEALQNRLNQIPGLQLAVFQPPSLPGSRGMPIQFVLKGSGSAEELAAVSKTILMQARKSGLFAYIDNDLVIDQPQITIDLDRNKIGELGLKVEDIGDGLNWLLGGGYVNYFSRDQRSYRVMPMVTRNQRLNAEQILNYPIAFVPQPNGPSIPVPLSTVATLTHQVVPEQIAHFQQLNATTLQGIPRHGVSTDQAYAELQKLADRYLPGGFATDTSGSLRDYIAERGSFLPGFGFGLVIIFLALAALFESFRDPLIILISVPMSVAGAMLFLWLGIGGASINLYSEIGLVSLAGLISKHGILIVEVANEQQARGSSKLAAIEHAALLRLRPILMTSGAMVLGVLPLLFASGAGAASRYVMGLVLASGLAIGTVFTLFIVPAFYLLLARRRGASTEPAPDMPSVLS
ncbi:efflux RND transporter permease subunit [Nguyenibacter vanlangensis]|uniref:Efflux RND transporter permease subunit n=1 Tax=Nguyenibacter vanlangensis TaxID=1216886 RepID=A0ABZ3DAA3_9PROT